MNRSFPFPSRRFALAGLAIAGLLAIGASASQAADPFVAGGPSTRAVAVAPDAAARAGARAKAVVAALGLPGVGQRVERVDDRFEHRTVDEVTSLDASGRAVAITRLELDGSVAMAVGLGWHDTGDRPLDAGGRPVAGGRPLDAPGAAVRAEALARAVGIVPAGRPEIRSSAGGGGWSVSWGRTAAGAVVRGDGLRVTMWPDGALHGLARTDRPLAPLPGRQIGAGAARDAALAIARRLAPEAASSLRVVTVDRVWVAPNDMFGGPRLDAPASTLRLAWAVRLDATGTLADQVRSLELWIDAGDASPLGGDVIQ